jgi:hypothetical protein
MSELAEKVPALETDVILCERFGCRITAKTWVRRQNGHERRAYCLHHALEAVQSGGINDGSVFEVPSVADEAPVKPAEQIEVIQESESFSAISPGGQAILAMALPKPKRHQLVAV